MNQKFDSLVMAEAQMQVLENQLAEEFGLPFTMFRLDKMDEGELPLLLKDWNPEILMRFAADGYEGNFIVVGLQDGCDYLTAIFTDQGFYVYPRQSPKHHEHGGFKCVAYTSRDEAIDKLRDLIGEFMVNLAAISPEAFSAWMVRCQECYKKSLTNQEGKA